MNPLFSVTFILLCLLGLFGIFLYHLYYSSTTTQIAALIGITLCCISPFLTYTFRTLFYVGFYLWRNFIFQPNPKNILQPHSYSGRVWISDIDVFLHMNNGRYRRAMDFARLSYYADCGFLDRGLRTGSMALMVAATARYRQALQLFQSYTIVTKLVYWDEEKLYFEQSFVSKYRHSDKFVYSRNLISMKTIKESPRRILEAMLGTVPATPTLSEELQHFIKYNEVCSASLKKDN